MHILTEYYDTLKARKMVESETVYSRKWLGGSSHAYYHFLINIKKTPPVNAMLHLLTQLTDHGLYDLAGKLHGEIMQQARKPL